MRRKRRALTPDEVKRLLAVAGVRELVYRLALGTGLRRRELQRLQWRDVVVDDTDRPCLTLRPEATKARRGDTVPLTAELAARLMAARPDGFALTGPVFKSVPTFDTWCRDLKRARIAHGGDDGSVEGLARPRTLLLPLVVVPSDPDPWWHTWAPDIRSHDWSPDGTAIVYDSTKSELCAAALPAGRITRITTVPAIDPVWSPDGQRIAFRIGKPFREIATIRPDGRDLKTVTVHPSGEWFSVTTPMWSPTGGHLVYRQVSVPKAVELPADVDVFVASADGGFRANLTADVDKPLTPVAWRRGDAYETTATAQPRQ